ncbi:MAG: hypothetical protein AABX34_07510 [Nanoarchaeota archaeon]
MAKIKSQIILLIAFLFSISLAFGEMQLSLPEEGYYNLGDKLKPKASIKLDEAHSGFFKVSIICTAYNLQYYTVPLDVESGFRTQVEVPVLSLSGPMLGECVLRADFDSINGETIDSVESESFIVEKSLNVNLSSSLIAKPGEEMPISGKVIKYNGALLEKGNAEIILGSSQYNVEVVSGNIEYKIKIESNREAGKYPLQIKVNDKYGNYGDYIFDVEVLAIPTKIENQISSNAILPGDKLTAKVTLFDHTNKTLANKSISVKIFNSNSEIIAQKDVQSTEYFEFIADEAQDPGSYYIISSFGDVKGQSNFVVEAVRKVDMKQEKGIVYVKNIGNVDYGEEVTILLENDGKKYAINKKISLKPKEQIVIDLSKEVPEGSYEITLPALDGSDINRNATEESLNTSQNVFSDVPIEDNRNALKKTADGVSAITGAVVGAAGYVASRPALATTILVLIIIGVVLHYSWGFLKERVMGRKKDSTEHLFKDFKYEEENKKL